MISDTGVSDSSVLIALARVGRLDLLPQLFSQVIVPPSVFREVTRDPTRPGAKELAEAVGAWLQMREVTAPPLSLEAVHAAEWDAIHLADAELNAGREVSLLLDERGGRAVAESMGLEPVGVLGLILTAHELGLVDRVAPLLDDLRAAGFRISNTLRQRVLEAADESEE